MACMSFWKANGRTAQSQPLPQRAARRAQLCWSPSAPARCLLCQLCPGIEVSACSGHPPPEGCPWSNTANDRCGQSQSQAGTGLVWEQFICPLLVPTSLYHYWDCPFFLCSWDSACSSSLDTNKVLLLIQQSHPCPYAVIYKLICVNPKKYMILQKGWGALLSLAETKQKKGLK